MSRFNTNQTAATSATTATRGGIEMILPMANLRLLYYPPGNRITPGHDQLGCGAHTDYRSITLLTDDGVGGLQVRDRQGLAGGRDPAGRARGEPRRHGSPAGRTTATCRRCIVPCSSTPTSRRSWSACRRAQMQTTRRCTNRSPPGTTCCHASTRRLSTDAPDAVHRRSRVIRRADRPAEAGVSTARQRGRRGRAGRAAVRPRCDRRGCAPRMSHRS